MSRTPDPDLAERRRRQILDAAMQCFGRRGLNETSMQEICGAAGLSAGAVYRYFPCKGDIIAAIVDHGHDGVDACLAAIEAGADVAETLCAFARDIAARGEAKSALAAHVISAALQDPSLAQRLAGMRRNVTARFARTLSAASKSGNLHLGVSADQAARIVVFLIDGLFIAAATRASPGRAFLIEDFRAILQRLFAGSAVAPDPAVRRSRKRPVPLTTGVDT